MFIKYKRPFVMVYTNEEGLEDAITIRSESLDDAIIHFNEGYQDCVLSDVIDIHMEQSYWENENEF